MSYNSFMKGLEKFAEIVEKQYIRNEEEKLNIMEEEIKFMDYSDQQLLNELAKQEKNIFSSPTTKTALKKLLKQRGYKV